MLDDRYIIRRLQRYISEAINSEEGDVTNVRQAMFDRYYGEQYGNERDGYSKYVSREVFEAVEWGLPALIRVFMGGKKAVEFRASGAADVKQAEHETDVVNYWFYDGNEDTSGFMILYSWLKDVLMNPNGYVSVAMTEDDDTDTQVFAYLPKEAAEAIQSQISEMDDTAEFDLNECEQSRHQTDIQLYDLHVMTTSVRRRIEVSPIPPDHVLIEHGYTNLDVDKANFVALREKKSRSDLLIEGYDEADLEDVGPNEDDNIWNDEEVNRLFYEDESPDDDSGEYDLPADETFWVHTCYVRIDCDEDGISELRKIVMVGCKILEKDEIDYQPIVSATAILMPHKHIGMSYAEAVSDLQELMTTLTRQMLDNIYKQNVRRKYVNSKWLLSDNSTMDALLDAESEVVVGRGLPQEGVMPEQVQSILGDMVPALQMMHEKPKLRTGVAPEITLDPSVLKESTLGAFVGAMDQASQRLELLARLLAETGLKKVMQKIHYLLRTYFTDKDEVEVNGTFVPTNPSTWKKRSNMKVNVGLGFNNKQAMITLAMSLLQVQREAMAAGLADQKVIHNTFKQLIEAMNFGHVDSYFLDPNKPGWKPPAPQKDPAMISAEAQAQSLAADAKRRDAELAHKKEMDKREQSRKDEEQTIKLTDQLNDIDEINQKYLKLQKDLALADAQITELNHRAMGKNHGADPAESSSDDEFQRAGDRMDKGKKKEAA
jgi:hypothetical protein